jgi:hypothetical protein
VQSTHFILSLSPCDPLIGSNHDAEPTYPCSLSPQHGTRVFQFLLKWEKLDNEDERVIREKYRTHKDHETALHSTMQESIDEEAKMRGRLDRLEKELEDLSKSNDRSLNVDNELKRTYFRSSIDSLKLKITEAVETHETAEQESKKLEQVLKKAKNAYDKMQKDQKLTKGSFCALMEEIYEQIKAK